MKKLFIILITLTTFACSKESLTTVRFNVKDKQNFEIPPSNLLDVFTLVMPVKNTWDQQFKNNGADADQIKELKLKTLTLTVTAPVGQTLRFLDDIEIFISADGLVEKKIAFKENIPDDVGQVLELDVVDTDLSAYAKKNEFKLKVNTTKDEVNAERVYVQADMLFGAVADVFK